MMREPSIQELRHIVRLASNENTILVGGMSISILAEHFGLKGEEPIYTKDADFVGNLYSMQCAEDNLSGFSVRSYLSDFDDAISTPNSGKLAVDISPDVEPVEIDFLSRLDGLSNDEIEQKSFDVVLEGKSIRVLHPILAMESKIGNLALYPSK